MHDLVLCGCSCGSVQRRQGERPPLSHTLPQDGRRRADPEVHGAAPDSCEFVVYKSDESLEYRTSSLDNKHVKALIEADKDPEPMPLA